MLTTPDPKDISVGARLRQVRRESGHNQHALAEALSLTYQQVQKYETGANRISASKLWEAALFLGVQVSDFFVDENASATSLAIADLDRETRALLAGWRGIGRADQRAAVLALVRSLSDEAS